MGENVSCLGFGRFWRCMAVLSVLLGCDACANPTYYGQSYENERGAYELEMAEQNPSLYEGRLAGGLFEMYPTYWRLSKNLAYQDTGSVADFARRYFGSALAEKLAADYAEEKARLGDYAAVRAIAGFVTNPDMSERCALALGFGDGREKLGVWYSSKTLPELCQTLAANMGSHPSVNATDRHLRLVRLLRIDNRRLSSRRPKEDTKQEIAHLSASLNIPISVQDLNEIAANPQGFLANSPNRLDYRYQYLYLYAVSQLALVSIDGAIDVVQSSIQADNARTQHYLMDMTRRYAYRTLAVRRMNLLTDKGFDRRVLEWFGKSVGEPFNDEESEDYAQAALYFGDWQALDYAIKSMPSTQQGERVWRYWLARAAQYLGKAQEAGNLYQSLTDEMDYYGILARERLGMCLGWQELDGSYPSRSPMQDPHFARALLMMRTNVKPEHTNREWNWAVKQARERGDLGLIVAAAQAASAIGNYSRSIYAMENSPAKKLDLSHPMPYKEATMRFSHQSGIDAAWVYGIMRQESRFQANAKSSQGATGLMQIMPSTARSLANGFGERAVNLDDPVSNIRYGSAYLAKLKGQMSSTVVATASYNAGPNAAKQWLPNHAMQADQFVEAIPYLETKEYVKAVMTNTAVYGLALGTGGSLLGYMGNLP